MMTSPGALWSGRSGRGNQFWNFLWESGLTPVRLQPEEDSRVLDWGLGLTDIVKRWSASASSLRARDYRRGVPLLLAKLQQAAPRAIAFNGKLAYEKFSGRRCSLGPQKETLAGARVFVLPCTSGRNGSMTRDQKFGYFRQLAGWLKLPSSAEEG
ncbi:MAG TPA: mismatch-specific DNA-glycosylase [Terriglobia bacterium]|nr:mismatch-specific DNA-glycosylase [Terriglobia bacterium]